MSRGQVAIIGIPATESAMKERRLASIGWAISHAATREAYRRCTGEDIAPALERYQQWLEENLFGRPDDFEQDSARGAA